MEIVPGVRAERLALFLEREKTLVIGDLHLGYEQALNERGVFVPRTETSDIVSRLGVLMDKFSPNIVVLLGDVKHDFGRPSRQEWRATMQVLRLVESKSKVCIVKGNHDNYLESIAGKAKVEVVPSVKVGNWTLVHGDKSLDEMGLTKAKKIILGHEHPAVKFIDGLRFEKYKCYLHGKVGPREFLLVPSFTMLTEGTDVLRDKPVGPLIKSYDSFEVYAVSNTTLRFGEVVKLKRALK